MISTESVLHELETTVYRRVLPRHGERLALACARALVECLYLNFRRQPLYVPTGVYAEVEERHKAIWADFNGRNHAELGIKYRLSLQSIYEITKRMRKTALKDRQADLFPPADEASAKPQTLVVLEEYLPADLARAGLPENEAADIAAAVTQQLCADYPGTTLRITSAIWQKCRDGGDLFAEFA